ncbi:MAG: lipase [Nocardioidaceae bacterium]|nr:lipase [Nocardioidaceae bacterium]
MLDSLSPARRRFVLFLAAIVGAALAVVFDVVATSRDEPVVPVAQDRVGPVLLVPGYGGSTRSLAGLATALRSAGRDVTTVELAGDGRGDLRAQARVLDQAVERALVRTSARSVDVIGYSAGGIIARLWVKDLGGGAVARRVLTLGSPHHGTELAGYASDITPDTCPAACIQLAPQSDFMRGLNSGDDTPDGPLWISIWTTDDQVVTPPASARLEGALNFSVQSVCPRRSELTHSNLPADAFVIAVAVRELDLAEPATPSARDCAPSSRR